ncbi:MAG: energy transducer TonB [Bacteroidetes bacterium]|nr:energy transducer TonB [Bacteroidota bacterium]
MWIIFVFGILSINLIAQNTNNPDYVYRDSEVDSVPVFPGGKTAMMSYMEEGLKQVDFKGVDTRGCKGMLVVSFIVEKSGKVSAVEIIRPLCQKVDGEVEELIWQMPSWKPGFKAGVNVRVKINMPVRFLVPINENE